MWNDHRSPVFQATETASYSISLDPWKKNDLYDDYRYKQSCIYVDLFVTHRRRNGGIYFNWSWYLLTPFHFYKAVISLYHFFLILFEWKKCAIGRYYTVYWHTPPTNWLKKFGYDRFSWDVCRHSTDTLDDKKKKRAWSRSDCVSATRAWLGPHHRWPSWVCVKPTVSADKFTKHSHETLTREWELFKISQASF